MPGGFIDIAQQCAPEVDTQILAAVVSVESGFEPFAIRINADHPLTGQPRSRPEAIETATILIAEGNDIDLGLGGVGSGQLNELGLTIGDAFDACLNLKATATLLDGYYRVALRNGATASRAETLMLRSYYGHGDAAVGEMVGYDRRVLAERDRLGPDLPGVRIADTGQSAMADRDLPLSRPEEATGVRQSAPETPAPRWDVYNSGRHSSVLVFSSENKE